MQLLVLRQIFLRSYCSVLVLLLLGKQFVGSIPIVICSADDRKYLHNGICCNMCRPGDKLERHCEQDADDGVCAPCPRHYYTAVWNYASDCRAVNPCNKSHEYIRTPAASDGSSDNECACELGYQYSPSGDICLKIREAEVVTPTPPNQGKELNTDHPTIDPSVYDSIVSPSPSENRTEPQIPTGITNSDDHTKYLYIIGFLVGSFLILLIIIGVFLVCHCRKKKIFCFRNRTDGNHYGNEVSEVEESNRMLELSDITHDDTLEDEGTGTGAPSSRRTSGDVHQNDQNDSTGNLSSGFGDDVQDQVSMAEEDRNNLRNYMENFVNDLPTQKVLDRMPTIFDPEDNAKIKHSILDECEQRRKLIEVLITKGPTAFDEFVKVLEVVCKHLADGLKKEKKKRKST